MRSVSQFILELDSASVVDVRGVAYLWGSSFAEAQHIPEEEKGALQQYCRIALWIGKCINVDLVIHKRKK